MTNAVEASILVWCLSNQGIARTNTYGYKVSRSRGDSGALYLQSATAGVVSFFEGWKCAAVPYFSALKSGSCAIDSCEPCQAGNRAALSSMFDVPQGCLFRVEDTVNAYISLSDLKVYGLTLHLALFTYSVV